MINAKIRKIIKLDKLHKNNSIDNKKDILLNYESFDN